MKTNDLKKGDRVLLANGWFATVMDNRKGDRRMLNVEGFYTEMGDVYSHDIKYKVEDEPTGRIVLSSEGAVNVILMEHTAKQLKLKAWAEQMGM